MIKYRLFLFLDDELEEDYGEFRYLDKTEKEARKLSRKFTSPKAKVRVFGKSEDELFPDLQIISTWQMGRKIKN